jgi:hypothetical protein
VERSKLKEKVFKIEMHAGSTLGGGTLDLKMTKKRKTGFQKLTLTHTHTHTHQLGQLCYEKTPLGKRRNRERDQFYRKTNALVSR